MKYCSRTKFMTDEDREKFLAVKDDNGEAFRRLKMSRQSIENMDDGIIGNINSNVQPEDELWILGDFVFANNFKKVQYYRNSINCKTVKLIWGNHDDRWLLKYYGRKNGLPDLFQGYYDSGLFYQTDDGLISEDELAERHEGKNPFKKKQKWYFNHYPNFAWNGHHRGIVMIHGHCHGSVDDWKKKHIPNANCFDVGVDVVDYKPVLLSEIISWKKEQAHDIDHHSSKMKIVRDKSGKH